VLARFRYYTSLALRDLIRLWSSTQHHVVIVAGICLPILLLLGLKRGHVEELRRELMTSPSGRQIVFWASQDGELLDAAGLDALQKALHGAELMIPDQQRVVSARRAPEGQPLTLTLYSTRKGDPILGQYQADVLQANEKAIVLPTNVAESLGVSRGDAVEITVRREVNGQDETATVALVVKALYPAGGDKSDIGYVDAGVLSSFEQFVRGYAVPSFNWQAAPVAIPDSYAAYVYLYEKGQVLTRDDMEYLTNRGLMTEEIDTTQPWELSDFIKAEAMTRLRALRIFSESSRTDPARRLKLAPSELTEVLSIPDDIAIPWNAPLEAKFEDLSASLVGLSLPRRCWLRGDLVAENLAFPFDASAIGVVWPFRASVSGEFTALRVCGDNNLALPQSAAGLEPPHNQPVPAEGDHPPATPATAVAIVPVDFLARMTSLHHSLAIFDPQTKLIAPVPATVVYDKVRLFAKTIDDVPSLAERLYNAKFAVQSEDARIQEIHEQDSSLRLLVFVVGLGVFLFGVLTVISVLVDSTDRKRGTLGILRVMGVSKLGVFWIVVLRAAVIGFLAGCMSVVFGKVLAAFLEWPAPTNSLLAAWKPTVRISLTPQDILLVFLGALICAALGAIYPAIRASRIDPFDAIVEGRFR
jgi:ABC-type lipoprotein release transport system permease subunit